MARLQLICIMTRRFEMADSIEKRKLSATQRLEQLQSLVRPDLGSHKRIKLQRAGCGDSGSLLHDVVSAQHGALLLESFNHRFSRTVQDQLRFLTVLHSLTYPTLESVMDAIFEMETRLRQALTEIRCSCIGAVEVEIVNLALLRRMSSLSDNEARKLNVLQNISDCSDGDHEGGALVHFHGVVDLTSDFSSRSNELRSKLSKVGAWTRSPYQIELKNFFMSKTIAQNLLNIARYITKGGNENLRYNAGFGRDLPEDIDAKIWRAGTGRADKGGETFTDERALTLREIALLDHVWSELMSRRSDQRGYLIDI